MAKIYQLVPRDTIAQIERTVRELGQFPFSEKTADQLRTDVGLLRTWASAGRPPYGYPEVRIDIVASLYQGEPSVLILARPPNSTPLE